MALETPLKFGFCSLKSPLHRNNGFLKKKPLCVQVSPSTAPGSDVMDNEIRKTFLEERRTNGDFISKVSDMLWIRDMSKFADMETNTLQENLQQLDKMADKESTDGGFLKLTKTNEWVSGDSVIAPVNMKLTAKDWQNDSEKRKKLNFLRYEAIKRELLFLTIGIGTGCCAYCLIVFSMEAAVSYAAGVLFSCLYLQLLYYHADNLSREAVPKIFLQKKVKKIGIRSEDLENTLEKIFRGSTMALSSPRLVIPAALYGICILSQHILNNFEFQIVPAMLGFFAYKAAALVQVYRDNEDLRLIFPESEE